MSEGKEKIEEGNLKNFKDWIDAVKNGGAEYGFLNMEPTKITDDQEKTIKELLDTVVNKFKDKGDSFILKFTPTGGCTFYYNRRKVAAIKLGSKKRIEVEILRDYTKDYLKQNIEDLDVEDIREKQISHKIPWGYQFYLVTGMPQNINDNLDRLASLIGDGIKTIDEGKILSLKKDEYNKLQPIFNSGVENNNTNKKSESNTNKIKMNIPLNQILYGPPGTGKTYTLQSKYFDKYTSKETSITNEQYFESVVVELAWWQVIALSLLETGKSKVSELYENRWIKQKVKISKSKTVRQTLWGQLQSHTISDSDTVNVKDRSSIKIFNKTKDSYWEILEDEVKEQAPDLYKIKESVDNYNPDPDKEINRYVFTTFHQSFTYEDFIEGIKPVINDEENSDLSYIIEPGIFKKICERAENDPENKYAIFIDEINRGNIASIFGELITLIEVDKRKGEENELEVTLPYSKEIFSVPNNLDIIGTMNTADRSVEALDSALRRRFTFEEMPPKPEVLKKEHKTNGDILINGTTISLIDILEIINERIEILLDRDHLIGHSFFMKVNDKETLKNTFAKNIIPLLQEHFYGDYGKISLVLGEEFCRGTKVPINNVFAKVGDYDTSVFEEKMIYTIRDVMSDKFNVIKAVNTLLNK